MTTADYAMFAFYLAVMIGIGAFFSRENTSAKEMFAAGGRSPWWVSGLSSYMTFFSAGAFVVWGGLAYKYGFVAIAINLAHALAALLTGYFVAGKWKQIGVTSAAEYVELRFGRRAVSFYTWVMMSVRMISSAVALYSLAVLIAALLPIPEGSAFEGADPGRLNPLWLVIIFGLIIMVYTMIGGLWAVLMTDVLQFLIILVTVVFTFVLILPYFGDMAAFQAAVPDNFLSATNVEYSLFFLAGWMMLHFFQFGAEWSFAQRSISVPRPRDARRAMYLFGGLYLISPFIFYVPPMIYRAIDGSANPEQAYIMAAAMVLPTGMLGMVMAAMFSATASMVSTQLNVYAGALTTQLAAHAKSAVSERRLVNIGRGLTVVLGLIVTFIAAIIPYLGGLEAIVFLMMSFVGPLFAPAVWGLFGKRIGVTELFISIGVSIFVALILKAGLSGPTLFGNVAWLKGLIDWAAIRPRTLDIYYSVITPVITLTLLHWNLHRKGVVDPRAEDLAAQAATRHPVTEASVLPARVVAVALVLSAATLAVLLLVNTEHRLGLALAAGVMMIAALGMAHAGWRRTPAPATSGPTTSGSPTS